MTRVSLVVAALLLALGGAYLARAAEVREDPPRTGASEARPRPPEVAPPIAHIRPSAALGKPNAGRLVRGVRLPAESAHFFTWDPIRNTRPNRPWRRFGTDRLLRVVRRVIAEYAAANAGAPRVGIGDLSRPRGGDFGPRFGPPGHASHQNGLDVDVYYPRRDGRERAPRTVKQIDRRLAQDLVDRFARAGAQYVFVGPRTGLRGRRGVVEPLVNHDNHLHFRLRALQR